MKTKKEWFRKAFILVLLTAILGLFILAYSDISDRKDESTKEYYIEHTFQETGSKNFVTGIYLDYRLFDSVFEAALLLITATGIVFIAQKEH